MRNRFESFALTILELNRCVQKIKEIELRDLNLKPTHGMVIYYLGRHPKGLTSAELSSFCKEDKAAISRAVKYLIENGYVRTEEPADSEKRNYRNPLFLTEKGVQVEDAIADKLRAILAKSNKGVTHEQSVNMYASLEKITENLSAYIDMFEDK